MKVVSVILARGGSKGIPRKNLAQLRGKPLVYYTIKASQLSLCEETWVCTDDEEIAAVSSSLGAKVLIRPPELARDESPSDPSLLFFSEKVDFDILVFIQPTSPLLTPPYINEGIRLVSEGSFDSVFSAYDEHWLPRWSRDGNPVGWDINSRPRRQDSESLLVENGAFYVTSKEALLSSGLRYGGKIGHVIMRHSESFQVDSPDDLILIERLLPELYYN